VRPLQTSFIPWPPERSTLLAFAHANFLIETEPVPLPLPQPQPQPLPLPRWAGFTAKLNAISAPLRQSLTYDRGKEMTRHAELAANTGVRVYFCDPHSPWQRGTCENTNGLLRQYLPKGTDLSVYSQEQLDAIADSLNTRPRATHNWLSPLQVYAAALASAHQPANSVH
jgi:IS30 family transposase